MERSLPLAKWTHQAHLTVALYYVMHYSLSEATCHLRAGIVEYNRASGGRNTPQSGYHETITLFWVHITRFYVDTNPKLPFLTLCQNFLESEWARKDLALHYYTRERLLSEQARAFWTEPDVKVLPVV